MYADYHFQLEETLDKIELNTVGCQNPQVVGLYV